MRYFKFTAIIILLLLASMSHAQSISLAMNYVDQGEYEKAKSIYEKLYYKNSRKQDYLLGLVNVHVQLQEYENAQKLLKNHIASSNRYPNLMVELGYVFQLEGDSLKANIWYDKAIDIVKKRSVFAYTTGQTFQKHNLLDLAIKTYEIAKAHEPRINYNIQLARLYGENGNEEKMFESYLDLILQNEKYLNVIQRNFSSYIDSNPQNESNVTLKRLLIKRLQQSQNVIYNQILSWTFIQENSFNKAFAQEKAIYKRTQDQTFNRLFSLGEVAKNAKSFDEALKVYTFIYEATPNLNIKLKAVENLMDIQILQGRDKSEIDNNFKSYFELFGYSNQTIDLQLSYAAFKAFTIDDKEEALKILEQSLTYDLNRFQQAKTQMLMADVLVAQEQYNRALIKYSLVSKQVKNTTLAQEAKYKTAMTSYYKGDFDWALTQLKVLKKATTQTIANDALEMSRFIKDGKSEIDSTQQALKAIAKVDLLTYQNKLNQALEQLDEVIQNTDNFHLLDQAHFKKAQIFEKQQKYQRAVEQYDKLVNEHSDSFLVDNALFSMANIQYDKLNLTEDAQKNLETLIFNYQDSIYFTEARKLYRKIRGDQNLQ
ncbi:tetratricopeptide repeat protein [Mesohalobacter halotolerans]|uniref:Tetratricopeptide repeat protein n=2 Tax=Mesohalobacter halotolerans TaxID=1883405 RepID=A0A4V6ALI2_9FLAO|nr:tetratricopeptide repeat protein [Mesohalobacter halotolerans]